MNAADQTKRSQQYDERRRKHNINLKHLSLPTYKVQNLQKTGKFDQLTLKTATLPIDIVAVQKHWMITSLEVHTIKRNDGEFAFIFATAAKKKLETVANCKAYNSIELSSDHRIVSPNSRFDFENVCRHHLEERNIIEIKWFKTRKYVSSINQDWTIVLMHSTMHKDIVEIVADTAQKVIDSPPKRRYKEGFLIQTWPSFLIETMQKEVPPEEDKSHKRKMEKSCKGRTRVLLWR